MLGIRVDMHQHPDASSVSPRLPLQTQEKTPGTSQKRADRVELYPIWTDSLLLPVRGVLKARDGSLLDGFHGMPLMLR